MKVTHVRISILESGPGYNNSSCTLEAAVEDGEDWQEVANELRAMCKQHVQGGKEVDRLWQRVHEAQEELVRVEREAQRWQNEVKANREHIRSHDKLAAIARREGIDPGMLDEIPF